MGRGGRRPGTGVKKGDKRGPYTKSATKKTKSKPTAASTAMLAAFIASGDTEEAQPQDAADDGAAPAWLEEDDTCNVHANDGPGAHWQLADVGRMLARTSTSITTTTRAVVRAPER